MSGYRESKGDQENALVASLNTGTKRKNVLTQERVRELFDYDPDTGIFTRKIKIRGGFLPGIGITRVGCGGYVTVSVDKKAYYLHRLVWLWWYGSHPTGHVDHINRVRSDNRIHNLREASHRHNLINSQLYSNNASGVKGVGWYKRKGKWVARINGSTGKSSLLGYFSDFTEAVAHRYAAEQCLDWYNITGQSSAHHHMKLFIGETK